MAWLGAVLRGATAGPALGDRDFRLLAGSALLNSVGGAGGQVVIGWLVLQQSGSSFLVGVSLAIYFAPLVLLGVPAGALADWLDRRSLLRVFEAAQAATFLALGALSAGDGLALWHLLALTFVSGCFGAMHQPSRMAYAVDITGRQHALSAIGLLNVASRFGALGGALLAGGAMAAGGPAAAFAALACAHGVAFVLLLFARPRHHERGPAREPLAANVRAYLAEMRHNRTLLMLVVLTAAVEVLGFSFATALPGLVRDVLGGSAAALGALHAVRAGGGLVAAVAVAGFGGLRRPGLAFLGTLYVFGVSTVLLGLSPGYVSVVAALVVVSAMAALSDIFTQTLMQLSVGDALRGRAMGAWVLAIGSAPIGHLQMGALVSAFGVGAGLVANGVGLLAVTMVAQVAAPRLRRL